MLTKMKIPKFSKIWVFGSILTSRNPNDCDVLIVYDSKICHPKDVLIKHRKFLESLSRNFFCPIHPLFLSVEEEINIDFINRIKAIPFNDAIIKFNIECAQ